MYQSFRDMQVWQVAMEIAEKVHALTDSLPRKEDYGFTSQVRRSALSISANIAEGFGRKHVQIRLTSTSIPEDHLPKHKVTLNMASG